MRSQQGRRLKWEKPGLARWPSIPALDGLAAGVNLGLEPMIAPFAAILPGWALFATGVGMVTLNFRLFDCALPQMRLERTGFSHVPRRLVYRPEVMFLMGLVITLLTMSVSIISVGILVTLAGGRWLCGGA